MQGLNEIIYKKDLLMVPGKCRALGKWRALFSASSFLFVIFVPGTYHNAWYKAGMSRFWQKTAGKVIKESFQEFHEWTLYKGETTFHRGKLSLKERTA